MKFCRAVLHVVENLGISGFKTDQETITSVSDNPISTLCMKVKREERNLVILTL